MDGENLGVDIIDAFSAMCRFHRQWLLYNRLYERIRCAGRNCCNTYTHFGLLESEMPSIMSHVLAINHRLQPLQSSEPSAVRHYTAIRRVMHQPLSRFSTHRGKCVDYVDTSRKRPGRQAFRRKRAAYGMFTVGLSAHTWVKGGNERARRSTRIHET